MGGLEYEAYDGILKKDKKNECSFNPELYQDIINKRELFILPGITKGTGQFPESNPRVVESKVIYKFEDIISGNVKPAFFEDPDTAYAVLNLSLAIQTKVSLDRIDMQDGWPIYTEGGFANNEAYNILVAAFFPQSDVFLTNLKEATAYGAAIMGKTAIENADPRDFKHLLNIERIPVKKHNFEGLDEYARTFLSLL